MTGNTYACRRLPTKARRKLAVTWAKFAKPWLAFVDFTNQPPGVVPNIPILLNAVLGPDAVVAEGSGARAVGGKLALSSARVVPHGAVAGNRGLPTPRIVARHPALIEGA